MLTRHVDEASPIAAAFERIWIGCGQRLREQLLWCPGGRSADDCRAISTQNHDCLSRIINNDAWARKEECIDKKGVDECGEEIASLRRSFDNFRNVFNRTPVQEYAAHFEKAEQQCAPYRKKHQLCVELNGEFDPDCLYGEMVAKQCEWRVLTRPAIYRHFAACHDKHGDSYLSKCQEEVEIVKMDLNESATSAVRAAGFQPMDFARYGGPHLIFRELIFPLMRILKSDTKKP